MKNIVLVLLVSALALTGCQKGDKGDAGGTGGRGEIGLPGVPGNDGNDGAPGQDGQDGTDGTNGSDGQDGVDGLPGLDAPTPTPTPAPNSAAIEQSKIDSIILQENLYRYNNLSSLLTKGMLCRVYKYANSGNLSISGVPNTGLGTLTQAFAYPYTGYFAHSQNDQNQGLSFLPDVYRLNSLYQTETYVDCQGQLVVTETKLHNFQAFSDDNLILTINGVKVVNDDTNHGVYSVSSGGFVSLKDGQIVSIRVQYRQYNGASVLQVYQNSGWLEPKYLYH